MLWVLRSSKCLQTTAKRYYSTKLSKTAGLSSWTDSVYTTNPIDKSEPTFGKILIANRGEIAVRVIRSAKKMGIKTVAVYSTADSRSMHVEMADEAICIGDPPAAQSYLVMDKILDAIKTTGAEAVHPGYGFLSENASFVQKLEELKVKFIGPPAKAIHGMGDKLESKRLAIKAGVHTVPGFDGEISSEEHCLEISNSIGYPVMIKASAGGGGKGMRIANNPKEAVEGFNLAKNEAKASFGDDRILIEKFVVNPRHIEIQILCDAHGNGVYLNERECSIQRRNQKVIEEAPSPFVDPALRQAMGQQALDLANAIGYTSAGTVEFLVDNEKNFYFLEMNTRLQVEHPITECITGVDLVQEMIRVAYGHPLKFKQNDIPLNGWALEMRVYAEDATRNFGTPSTGRLFKYVEPSGEGVRCDSGVREGSEISVYYDPMICKLVTYGKTRHEAIGRGKQALDSYVIQGVSHNIPLLRDILSEESYVKGDTDTNYLPRVYPDGFTLPKLSNSHLAILQAISGVLEAKRGLRLHRKVDAWDYVASHGEQATSVKIVKEQNGFKVNVEGEEITLPNWDLTKPVVTLNINGEDITLQVHGRLNGPVWRIGFQGSSYDFKLLCPDTQKLLHIMPDPKLGDTAKELLSPMPGVVKGVSVKVGDKVFKGQEVCVIEAMKMQNQLVINADGEVAEVRVKVGDTVSEEDLLVALK
ncbi:Propionyl-CoA carboxylase alpha chain, mitochondrial [Orchesella cincta]|uniref:Propionyl-CoA carboxylase alpha chain, mitochondrial n=1 Tax=Orchesella cincta TaxID=48709 RepID=A0A1D2NJ27_ORCCI|nr:Propionyl-CoA carboxylase alpha chain, mitochondrial [Orchesella cincta]